MMNHEQQRYGLAIAQIPGEDQAQTDTQEAGGHEMAAIQNPRIRIDDSDGNDLVFTCSYEAIFPQHEVGREFEEAARLWENDGGSDERVTSYDPPRRFTATAGVMTRDIPVTALRSDLSTEPFNEEIYGQIWLRRVGAGPADDERTTANGSIDVNA
jgi:hypothetical protein